MIKLNRHNLFTQRWCWRVNDIHLILDELKEAQKPIIHICSGSSNIGAVRLDRVFIDGKSLHSVGERSVFAGSPNVLGSMIALPFRSGIAGTVICDPPYDPKWLLNGVYKELIDELVRIMLPGGRLVFYASYVLTHKNLKLLSMKAVSTGKDNHYFKILSVSTKSNGQLEDYV